VKLPEIRATMHAMATEMTRAGMIEEMVGDTMEAMEVSTLSLSPTPAATTATTTTTTATKTTTTTTATTLSLSLSLSVSLSLSLSHTMEAMEVSTLKN
jgi:hypothetical protein